MCVHAVDKESVEWGQLGYHQQFIILQPVGRHLHRKSVRLIRPPTSGNNPAEMIAGFGVNTSGPFILLLDCFKCSFSLC